MIVLVTMYLYCGSCPDVEDSEMRHCRIVFIMFVFWEEVLAWS